MSNPPGSIIWYELLTPDPDAAKRFYDGVIGWDIEPRPAGAIDYRMIRSAGGNAGGMMRLSEVMAAGGARPSWLMYVGVDDVDATAAAITAAGGTVTMPPTTLDGVGRMAMAVDPHGVPFYVMRPDSRDETSDVFDLKAVGRCGWNELSTPDQDAALGFYGGLFGWRKTGGMPMGAMGEYSLLDGAAGPLGAMMTNPPGGLPPHWTFYFRVPGIEAAAAAITAGGGTIHHGPVEVPGGDRVVIASDPQGAGFGLVASG